MWKNRLSYLASGTTLAILVMMAANVNAETIVSSNPSDVLTAGNPSAIVSVDRPLVNLNLISSSLGINPQQEGSSFPDLGCTCAACQKISTQAPL
jgi:hypothetical protein